MPSAFRASTWHEFLVHLVDERINRLRMKNRCLGTELHHFEHYAEEASASRARHVSDGPCTEQARITLLHRGEGVVVIG